MHATQSPCPTTVGARVAIKILVTLKSQSIRFQYGTILRPGRFEQSLAEH